ncbi:MAG: NLP/P60-family protein [Frankiales bacterium]|nr:NLP/P60-family protein [Frankiales bacterium]
MKSVLCALVIALAAPVVAVGTTVGTAAPASATTTSLGQRADTEARRLVGKPYAYGAAGPTRFDCSGFTLYVFSRLGKQLPHNSGAQYDAVRHVARTDKRIGDLVFTKRGGKITHVGVYAGGSDIWSPVQSGDHVRRQSFAGRDYVVGRVG